MAAVNKQIILAQIKKTAAENGGVPLGVLRFENATGIKQTDGNRGVLASPLRGSPAEWRVVRTEDVSAFRRRKGFM